VIKRYVNLPEQPAGDDDSCGPLIASSDSLGAECVAVTEWWVEAGSDNTDLKYLSAAERVRLQNTYVTNEKDEFKNHVILPHVGGDRYTVKCSKKGDRSSPMEVEEIETWRKFFYTVHLMNQDCEDLFNAVQQRFEDAFGGSDKAFIELEKLEGVRTTKDEPRTLSESGKEELPHLWPNPRPPEQHKPFHLHVFVVNDICELLEKVFVGKQLSGTSFSFTTKLPLSDFTSNSWLVSSQLFIEPDFDHPWDIAPFVTQTGSNDFQVDFSGDAALTAAAQDQQLTVKTTVRVMKGFCGYSLNNVVVVRINEPDRTPEQVKSTVLQTFTHEIGHACQQVVRSEDLFDPDTGDAAPPPEQNDKWDDSVAGSQGGHCTTNARPKPPVACPLNEYVHDSGTLCTMFYRDDPDVDSDGKFCDSCLPRLKRVNLDAAHMTEQGWDAY